MLVFGVLAASAIVAVLWSLCIFSGNLDKQEEDKG